MNTRVTLVGSRRRLDVVLPSGEPLGVLLPEFLELTDEPPHSPPVAYLVVGTDGAVLPDDRTLAESGVPDGSLLRLVPATDAPADAVVHDVADATTDDFDGRLWRWGAVARRWACTFLLMAALVGAAALVPEAATIAAAVLVLAGAVIARRWHGPLGVATVLAGGAVALYVTHAQPLLALAVVSVVVAVLGLCSELGRGGVFGGLVGLALLGLWVGLGGLPVQRAAAITAVVAVLALGVLPRLAVTASGLAGLDDSDGVVRRPEVRQALSAAHRGLTLATVAVACGAALPTWLLTIHSGRWTTPLACLVCAALLLRLRAFPLLPQVAALLLGSGVIAFGLLRQWQVDRFVVAGVLLAVVVAAVLRMVVVPKEHVLARFRAVGDKVELAVVLALVPVVIGEFGVYSRLLATF